MVHCILAAFAMTVLPLLRPSLPVVLLASLLAGCAGASLLQADPPAAAVDVPAAWQAAAPSPGAPPSAQLQAQWWQRFDDPRLPEVIQQALEANTDIRSAQAAQADERAAAATLAQTRVSLAAEVAVSYIGLRGLQARLALARQTLTSQDETLQTVRWKQQAGLASDLDVAQALTAAEQTRAQIPALEGSLAQSANSLAVLTGQPPGRLADLLQQPRPVPQARGELTLAIPARTLRQRPDVQASEQQVSAALARAAQAQAQRYPSFAISGSLGRQALTLAALGGGPATLSHALVASVSWPLWDGGAARAQAEAQQAALDSARSSYQAAVLAALNDVENALLALDYDRRQVERLLAAVTAATQAEALGRQRYQSGLIDLPTLLTLQRTLLSARDSAVSAQATLSADHVRLYKALGGGWQPEPEADSAPPAARS